MLAIGHPLQCCVLPLTCARCGQRRRAASNEAALVNRDG